MQGKFFLYGYAIFRDIFGPTYIILSIYTGLESEFLSLNSTKNSHMGIWNYPNNQPNESFDKCIFHILAFPQFRLQILYPETHS